MSVALLNHSISYFGVPKELHSDKGSQYESDIFTETCKVLGIEKTRTTTCNPQSNGFMEHMNRTLVDMLNCTVSEHPFEWDCIISLLAYNTSVQESTKESPYEMTFGHYPLLPIDFLYELPVGEKKLFPNASSYVLDIQNRLRNVHNHARQCLKDSAFKQEKSYNNRLKLHSYDVDDLVYLYRPNKAGSTKDNYFMWKGPFKIVSKLSDMLYSVVVKDGAQPIVVHHNKLKPAFVREKSDDVRPRRSVVPPDRFGEWCYV